MKLKKLINTLKEIQKDIKKNPQVRICSLHDPSITDQVKSQFDSEDDDFDEMDEYQNPHQILAIVVDDVVGKISYNEEENMLYIFTLSATEATEHAEAVWKERAEKMEQVINGLEQEMNFLGSEEEVQE